MYKRTIIGTLLFIIFVGELVVGSASGLYTVPGIPVFLTMYYLLFILYESLTIKYCLTYRALVPLTFGIYAVLVTGLLHGEIVNYIRHPQDNFVTTLIRIQCSFYPVFAYYVLNEFTKRDPNRVPSIKSILIACVIFVLILTPSKTFGLITLLNTLKIAPLQSLFFIALGVMAVVFALRSQPAKIKRFRSKGLNLASLILFILCLIPSLKTFVLLLIAMPIFGIIFLSNSHFGESQI